MRFTKYCAGCCLDGQELPIDEFGDNAGRADGKQAYCRQCQREAARKSWRKHRERLTALHVDDMRERRKRNREYIADVLADAFCVDCGERDPIVLEFDHQFSEEKDCAVAELVHAGASIERIQLEIDKCNVRCANDHKRRHARERLATQAERVVA